MQNDTAILAGGPIQDAATIESALGWTLKPEGLCRDDTCVIVPEREALASDAGIDVRVLGELLDRPVAVDEPSGVVAVGAPRDARRSALNDLKAPDFTLPDLDGTAHSLSDHRSKKRLLVAFSSW